MKSDFEKSAAQEAVAAVERRYERNQKLARRARGRGRLVRLAIAAAVVIGGYALWQNFTGGDLSSLASLESLQSFFAPGDSASGDRRLYGEALKVLLGGDVRLSADMPDELAIRKAKPGVRYVILTPPAADGWFGLYELVRGAGDVTISELSPVRAPRLVKAADLRAATGDKPYLVAVRGTAYLFGSKDPEDAARLRKQVRALARGR